MKYLQYYPKFITSTLIRVWAVFRSIPQFSQRKWVPQQWKSLPGRCGVTLKFKTNYFASIYFQVQKLLCTVIHPRCGIVLNIKKTSLNRCIPYFITKTHFFIFFLHRVLGTVKSTKSSSVRPDDDYYNYFFPF